MSPNVPTGGADQSLVQDSTEQEVLGEGALGEGALGESRQSLQANQTQPEIALEGVLAGEADVLDQAVQLLPKSKVALIRKLMTQLETDDIQAILDFGVREISDRRKQGTKSAAISHCTRLLLKKDYSYQERGLSEPTQYYVYLRRRKPKLDRYIGTLFYVPQGCILDYFLDANGCIVFNPPHNVFRLQDCADPSTIQIVRLICLEPPPATYTFTKQQNDTPAIYLKLEYLHSKTYESVEQQTYAFPHCMYEGGELDRYRWDVQLLELAPEVPVAPTPASLSPEPSSLKVGCDRPPAPDVSTPRQILELPPPKLPTVYLANPGDASAILKRMQVWVSWSEKAMPQAKWSMVQDGATYVLMNARFKRPILKFSPEDSSLTLANSLSVLIKWFHDLSLAVSQTQNQKQYSAAQLKLARSIFVDMSLPQTDPLVVLRKLFGVEFVAHIN
jgi:hypothetical protein